jgi:peptidyl-prolyl cis-trans isomerase SurA
MSKTTAIIVSLLLMAVASPAMAQQDTLKIAAVVNDEVISAYDLHSRLQLVIASTHMDPGAESVKRVLPQVLHSLIDEKLKLQAAKQLEVTVTETDLQNAFSGLERQNNLPAGQLDSFLQREGVNKEELGKQLRAEVAWVKTVQRKMARQITVGEEEINQILRAAEENAGKPENRVAEITLNVDTPDREDDVRQIAERLVQQLRDGGNFAALARSFSQGASATLGGDLGWVRAGQLAPEIEAIVNRLQPGELSTPIRSVTGYQIIYLINRRTAPAPGGSEEMLDLAQLFFPLEPQADKATADREMSRAQQMAGFARTCEDMEQFAKELGTRQSGRVGEVRLNSLPGPVKAIVATLPLQQASPPQRFPDGFTVLMVCSRKAVKSDVDEHERVQRLLTDQKMENAARQYLRDLRRTAFVDVRL